MNCKFDRQIYEEVMKKLKNIVMFESFANAKYWLGYVPTEDDFGVEITDEFIDGKTNMGPWATMSPASWKKNGSGRLGTGYGQKYKKQSDGKWLKIEG